VIGRERAHHRRGVAAGDQDGGQADGGTRIAWRRLDQQVLLWQVGQLAGDRGRVRGTGDDDCSDMSNRRADTEVLELDAANPKAPDL